MLITQSLQYVGGLYTELFYAIALDIFCVITVANASSTIISIREEPGRTVTLTG